MKNILLIFFISITKLFLVDAVNSKTVIYQAVFKDFSMKVANV